jgi:hypothetical protein
VLGEIVPLCLYAGAGVVGAERVQTFAFAFAPDHREQVFACLAGCAFGLGEALHRVSLGLGRLVGHG